MTMYINPEGMLLGIDQEHRVHHIRRDQHIFLSLVTSVESLRASLTNRINGKICFTYIFSLSPSVFNHNHITVSRSLIISPYLSVSVLIHTFKSLYLPHYLSLYPPPYPHRFLASRRIYGSIFIDISGIYSPGDRSPGDRVTT